MEIEENTFFVYQELLKDFVGVNDIQPYQYNPKPTDRRSGFSKNSSDLDSDDQDRHRQQDDTHNK